MDYAEYEGTDAYIQKHAGAGVRIVLYASDDPSTALIGTLTGINFTDDFEQLAVEEAGESGVNEIATGRHSGSLTLNGFFTPERNDRLPSRDSFIGENNGVEYTLMQVTGDDRVGTNDETREAVPLNVFEGLKLSRYSSAQGARGLITFDLAGTYTNRTPGKAWSEKTGA